MTAKEFVAELGKTGDLFRWECLGSGHIRGFLRTGESPVAFDPIGAVLFLKRGSASAQAQIQGGRILRLPESDTVAIRDAANDNRWKCVEGELVLDGCVEWLRAEIAAAVGLEIDDVSKPAAVPVEPARAPIPEGLPLEPEAALQHF